MSKEKSSTKLTGVPKPAAVRRKRNVSSYDYVHARYLADLLCDSETDADIKRVLSLGFDEMSLLLHIAAPKPEATRKANEAIRAAYLDMLDSLHTRTPDFKECGLPETVSERLMPYTKLWLTVKTADAMRFFLHQFYMQAEYPHESPLYYALKFTDGIQGVWTARRVRLEVELHGAEVLRQADADHQADFLADIKKAGRRWNRDSYINTAKDRVKATA